MKKLISALFALTMALSVCACSFAEGDTVTLAELKAQAPERLQMTVTTDAGNTITVDAPVILPDTDTLPVLQCENWHFDAVKAARDDDVYQAKACWGDHFILCSKESQKNLLSGKTDSTDRYALPLGSTPPENDLTLEQAMAFIMRHNELCGGDPNVDLRPTRVAAMSGLCKMDSRKVTAGGVSFGMIVANPDKPVKGKEKGCWYIEPEQYIHGVRIIDEKNQNQYADSEAWQAYPTYSDVTLMDEENFAFALSYLQEKQTLANDYRLADWSTVYR